MAEGARLESVFTRKGNGGSNPSLSASFLFGLCLPSSLHSSAFTNPKNDRNKERICNPVVASERHEKRNFVTSASPFTSTIPS